MTNVSSSLALPFLVSEQTQTPLHLRVKSDSLPFIEQLLVRSKKALQLIQ